MLINGALLPGQSRLCEQLYLLHPFRRIGEVFRVDSYPFISVALYLITPWNKPDPFILTEYLELDLTAGQNPLIFPLPFIANDPLGKGRAVQCSPYFPLLFRSRPTANREQVKHSTRGFRRSISDEKFLKNYALLSPSSYRPPA